MNSFSISRRQNTRCVYKPLSLSVATLNCDKLDLDKSPWTFSVTLLWHLHVSSPSMKSFCSIVQKMVKRRQRNRDKYTDQSNVPPLVLGIKISNSTNYFIKHTFLPNMFSNLGDTKLQAPMFLCSSWLHTKSTEIIINF